MARRLSHHHEIGVPIPLPEDHCGTPLRQTTEGTAQRLDAETLEGVGRRILRNLRCPGAMGRHPLEAFDQICTGNRIELHLT